MQRQVVAMLVVALAAGGSPAVWSQAFHNLSGNMALARVTMAPVEALRLSAVRRMRLVPGQPGTPLAGAPARRGATTAYRASPAVSARVKQAFAASITRGMAAADAARLRAGLAGIDAARLWTAAVRDNGLHPGDLADALAGYIALNWAMANGTDVDAPATLALRSAVRTSLLSDPAFVRLDDAGRQSMAENLMTIHLFEQIAFADARRQQDRAALAQLGALAETRLRTQMGLDLRAIRLTPHGVVARG